MTNDQNQHATLAVSEKMIPTHVFLPKHRREQKSQRDLQARQENESKQYNRIMTEKAVTSANASAMIHAPLLD